MKGTSDEPPRPDPGRRRHGRAAHAHEGARRAPWRAGVYERATPWNVAVPVRPAAVVLASTASDVADVMRFAAERGLRVAVQATGHGATAIGADNVLVLTAGMTGCVVDALSWTARVGGGVTWRTVLDAATPHGLAPLCGSAPAVGVVWLPDRRRHRPAGAHRRAVRRPRAGVRIGDRVGPGAPHHPRRTRRPLLGSAERQVDVRHRHRR
ncbi:MAG: hypothetical protein QOI01_4800 [Mycobacterium sp.]|nr:hypothetical protein [Mycobacterium sp.]